MQNKSKTTPSVSNQYASLGDRLLAFNIDLVLLLGIFYALGYYIDNNTYLYVACLVIYIMYDASFTASAMKGTPGKKLTRITVSDASGNALSIHKALFRSILKVPSAGVLFIGYLLIFSNPEKQGLHDRLTNAFVGYSRNH